MRPPKQKQPQVKKGLCRVLEHVDVLDVDVDQSHFLNLLEDYFCSIRYVVEETKILL